MTQAFRGRGTSRPYLGLRPALSIIAAMEASNPNAGIGDQAAIARLTEREKECLRAWLGRKTAKEIALDLDISHHAVEKRLKMARIKLNVTSSLEAAHLLAEAEGYQHLGAHSADLEAPVDSGQRSGSHAKTLGVATMSILVAATLALAMQASGTQESYGALPSSGAGKNVGYRGYRPEDMVQPTEAEIAVITQTTFDYLDEDKSGFLEGRESPVSPPSTPQPVYENDGHGNAVDTGAVRQMTTKEATDGFYELADKDGDGRVSYPEYHDWSRGTLVRIGIPAEWRANLQTPPAS